MMKPKPTICRKSKKMAEARAQLETEEFFVGPTLTPAYARAYAQACEASGGPGRYHNHQGCYHNMKKNEEDA